MSTEKKISAALKQQAHMKNLSRASITCAASAQSCTTTCAANAMTRIARMAYLALAGCSVLTLIFVGYYFDIRFPTTQKTNKSARRRRIPATTEGPRLGGAGRLYHVRAKLGYCKLGKAPQATVYGTRSQQRSDQCKKCGLDCYAASP